jgi:hypothetical protein
MGTNTAEPGPNHDWPLAFQAAMFKVREERGCTNRFRYVALSGKLVEQDQEVGLCFLEEVRKMKVSLPPLVMLGVSTDRIGPL